MKVSKQRRVVGYIRVSTSQQAQEGMSLDAQEERIKAYAKAVGLPYSKTYCDAGISGKNTDRPELARLLDNLDKIDVVVVYKFDRISRSVVDLYELLDRFREAGVEFKSVTEGVDTGSAIGEFIMNIFAGLAQMERKLIAERTTDTLRNKISKGEHCGRIPYGFKIGKSGKLVKDPEQQKVITRIKRLKRDGHSVRVISDRVQVPKSTVHMLINTHQKTRNAFHIGQL